MKGYLTLIGDDFDHSYVTETLGQSPQTLRLKEEVLKNGRLFGHCEWGVETEKVISEDFESLASELMNLLSCSRYIMKEVAQKCNAQWNILFYLKVIDEFPPIIFTNDFIQFSADIGAVIGFDGYC